MTARSRMSMTTAFAVVACLTAQAVMARQDDTRLERLLHDDRRTVLVASHRACWKKTSET